MDDPVKPHIASALIEEATKRSGLVWLTVDDRSPQAVWHVWHSGAVYLVSGGAEQPVPGLADAETVTVTVRSKDKGGRLVAYAARPGAVEPGSAEWDAVVPELHAKRLNPPDGEQQPARWARESMVTRLEPSGEIMECPGGMSASSHAAPPTPTPATTQDPLPFVLGRKRNRKRSRLRDAATRRV